MQAKEARWSWKFKSSCQSFVIVWFIIVWNAVAKLPITTGPNWRNLPRFCEDLVAVFSTLPCGWKGERKKGIKLTQSGKVSFMKPCKLTSKRKASFPPWCGRSVPSLGKLCPIYVVPSWEFGLNTQEESVRQNESERGWEGPQSFTSATEICVHLSSPRHLVHFLLAGNFVRCILSAYQRKLAGKSGG